MVVPFLGMKTSVVMYERDKRFAGETKYGLKSMIGYALESLTGISVEPLRKVPITVIASALVALSTLVGVFIVPWSWKPALVICTVISILFVFLFIVLSVIAEYLAQIYIEVKARPSSLIYEFLPSGTAQKKVTQ